MSIETINTVVTRFLKSDKPEVLAINGAWGVGKTYFWNQLVLKNKSNCGLDNYCYLSLFGITSITELRTTIFAKTIPIKSIDRSYSNSSYTDRLFQKWQSVKDQGFLILRKLKNLPYIQDISISLESLAPHLINNTIICLDDIERLSDQIKLEEVLGLISELKVEKKCKFALIFNREELVNKSIYERYQEKVIDIELMFALTALEAADLALPNYLSHRKLIKKYIVLLNIKNIRILNKIAALSILINEKISLLSPGVMERATMALVLFSWGYYDKNAPSIEFIKKWNQFSWANNKDDPNPQEKEWTIALQNYGFIPMDEFDLSISNIIQKGYLEETGFIEEAEKLNVLLKTNELEKSFTKAWDLFHFSYADNQDLLIEKLIDSFEIAIQHISVINLSATTMLLRELGQSKKADELIATYIEKRKDEVNLFDLDRHPFASHITDVDLIKEFKKHSLLIVPSVSLIEAVTFILNNNSWSNAHIKALEAATPEAFVELFKQDHGNLLHDIIKTCLQFENYDNHKAIGANVRKAINLIGKEHKLNSLRIRRYVSTR